MDGLDTQIRNKIRKGALALATVVALVLPAAASASSNQEMIMQDDPQLLGDPNRMVVALAGMKDVGVDRVRVSVFWNHVAPSPLSQRKPKFPSPGASWPGSYPRGSWVLYDRLVFAARQVGIGLLFTVTGPSPAWATPGRHRREGLYKPDPGEFRDFVKAVATRYSGAYPVNQEPPAPRRGLTIGGITIGGGNPAPAPSPDRLPRVDHWSIWNEPGYPSWLQPMWRNNHPKRKKDMVAAAPAHYRRLVDGAWSALSATGHGSDVILIGETSPRGTKKPNDLGNAIAPAEFVRELYCLRSNFKAYKGKAARLRGCPDTAAKRRRFRARHPGLFLASGYAHHPYSLNKSRWEKPTWRHPYKDNISIGNLRKLTSTLDRAAFFWGSLRPPMNVWITEYGYQTTPPDPIAGVAQDRQGPLTAWGEYLAYKNPRVASIAQFLLIDDKPVPGYRGNDPRRWVSWQSGLFAQNGRPKPFLQDFRRPLHVSQSGRRVRLFGTFRPANTGVPVGVAVQYMGADRTWRNLNALVTNNPRGYVDTPVTVPGPGFVRLAWLNPATKQVEPTRPTAVK